MLTHATHRRACLYRNGFITIPLQVTNRTCLPSRLNLHRVRDLAKPTKRCCPRRNRPFKSNRLSPQPPRQRLPSNGPIKTVPTRQPSNFQLDARGSPDRGLTLVEIDSTGELRIMRSEVAKVSGALRSTLTYPQRTVEVASLIPKLGCRISISLQPKKHRVGPDSVCEIEQFCVEVAAV